MDLVEFLRARLDEDEQAARAASGGHLTGAGDWSFGPGNADGVHTAAGTPVTRFTWPYEGEHIARHDPARVLRDIETKRAIVDRYEQAEQRADARLHDGLSSELDDEVAERLALEWVVRQLATAYADHPVEWKP